MIELDKILNIYGDIDTEVAFHMNVTNRKVDKNKARIFLDKYLFDEDEYFSKWKKIEDIIFQNKEIGLPKKIIKNEYSYFFGRGGVLFDERDFNFLQECILRIGDKNLIIVQNDFGEKMESPILRMKFPADISWRELMSGNFISSFLFEMPFNEYFVYSESGLWGKYAANDYDFPLDVVGYKSEIGYAFEKYKRISEEDTEDILEWIPKW